MKEFYSLIDISKIFRVKYETVRRWITSGKLKADIDRKPFLVSERSISHFIQYQDTKGINKPFKDCNFYTPKELGNLLMINRNTITRNIRNKRIDAIKIGGLYRIEEDSVIAATSIKEKEKTKLDKNFSDSNLHLL